MDVLQLKDYCLSIDNKKVILIMSESACRRFKFEEVVELMQKRYSFLWISDIVTYPNQKTLLMGNNRVKDFNAEVIIAIGGGSTIDFAKALKALYGESVESIDEVTDILIHKVSAIRKRELEIIAVPTTAGTGAELTKWATIWDLENNYKYSIDLDGLKPDKAIIVPELTVMADEKLSISTGLDALSHAVEAYWSKKTSVLVRQLAKQSIALILQNLHKIINEPKNLKYRENQCLASILAGLAFSMTRTTACHSISYPLTMKHNIAHGTAVAMTLAQVAEFNRNKIIDSEELFSLFRPFGGMSSYLEQLCKGRICLRLSGYGIKRHELDSIAESSFTVGRMDNNPVNINKEDVRMILEKIF